MKPAGFEYVRPGDIDAALALAAESGPHAKFIAGGQSLGPMLNLRLAQPDLVIDLTAIAALKCAEDGADALTIGSCITHADIEDGRVPDPTGGMLRSVAHGIAYRAVRNRGTIGGSLAHADPSADWVSCLAALGATVMVRGKAGSRALPAAEFMLGVFETALADGELITGIAVPRLSDGTRWGFYKACRKTGEFAFALGAVVSDPGRGVCRAVIGATASRPIVLADARPLFGGKPEAGLAAAFDPHPARAALTAAGVTDPVTQQMHVVALRRAAERAAA